jgi:3-oxoacyl-ACP reductase-like protein
LLQFDAPADAARVKQLCSPSSLFTRVIAMSVFGALKDKIFGHTAAAPAAPASRSAPAAAPSAPAATASSNVSVSDAATAPVSAVDVEDVLSTMAKESGKKYDWRNSIVDLLTLTGIDSSMANRRALATELGYTGDLNDSAPMNIWLHKQVLRKLSENGGQVPANLLD